MAAGVLALRGMQWGNSGGLGQIIIAIFLVLVGVIFVTGILQALLSVIGWITIIVGIVVGVMGLIGLFGKDRSGYY